MLTPSIGTTRVYRLLIPACRSATWIIVLQWAASVVIAQPLPADGDPLSEPLALAVRKMKGALSGVNAGADAHKAISAAVDGDSVTIRKIRDKLNIDDKARVALVALEVLGDPERDIIEPFTLLKYTFTVDRASHAMIPIADNRPTTRLIEKLKLELEFQPEAAPLTGHAIHFGLAVQLLRTAATNGSVVLADDVLFSRSQDPAMMERPAFSRLGSWTLLSYNDAVSERYSRVPYSVFVQKLLGQATETPVFCSGLWQDLLPYAEQLAPTSQQSWTWVYESIAKGFEAKRRYASGAFIRIIAANQKADHCFAVLLAALKRIPATDTVASRNIAIAYGYLVEALVHSGQDVTADRPDHRQITDLLASRLDARDMKSLVATRTAPRKSRPSNRRARKRQFPCGKSSVPEL